MFGTPEYQATAKLGTDGELAVKVTAFCGYGDRKATTSTDVKLDDKDAAKVTSILQKAIKEATVEVVVHTGETDADGKPVKEVKTLTLGQQVTNDAAEAFVTANRKGETV